jgi:ferritin-like metal-binding protein YciE
MPYPSTHTLSANTLRTIFLQQLGILYNAKSSLIVSLPQLTSQATFMNLKHALQEDLADSILQMIALKEIFHLMESSPTKKSLGIQALIAAALEQVSFKDNNHYESDMSVLFYMSTMENMQLGACKILNLLAKKIAYQPYEQLVIECLDLSRDNSRLMEYVSEEYFGN